MANDSFGVAQASKNDSTAIAATGLARDAAFVGLEGKMGNIRLGSPNSIGLEVAGDSSPLGTGVGSGYAGNAGTMMNSVVQTRYNRSVRYDSPAFSGLTVSVLYAPGNDQSAESTLTYQPLQVPNGRTATEVGLKYVNGPLTVSLVNIAQDAQINKTGFFGGGNTYLNAKTSANVFGANYKIANTTLYAGMNSGDRLAASATDGAAVNSKGTRYAIKQTIGQIDLIAQQTTQEASNVKAKVTGARADYNFSKTTAAYVGYEKWDTGAVAAAGSATAPTAATTGDRKIVSIGLRKSF